MKLLLILLLLPLLSIPIAFGQVVETKGQNYDLTENYFIGQADWESHAERIMINGQWENYALTNTNDKVIFNSNSVGSLIFDKNSCSYSIWENGYTGSNVIPSVSAVATYLNNGQWQNLPINDEACIVDVKEYNDSVHLTSTKVITQDITEDIFIPYSTENFNANSTLTSQFTLQNNNGTMGYFNGQIITTGTITDKFVQELRLDVNNGFKETFKIWHNGDQELGISQTIHSENGLIEIADQVIDIQALNGQSYDKQFIEDNKAEILQLTDSVSYEFSTGIKSLENVNIIFDGNYKVNLDYANGLDGVPFVGYLEIDPTFGYTSGTVFKPQTNNDTSGTCPSGSYSNYGGGEFVFKHESGSSGQCIRTVVEFDTTSIPDTSIITDTLFRYDVTSLPYALKPSCDFTPIESKPSSGTDQSRWTDIGDTTDYISSDTSCSSVGTDIIEDLGTTADSNLQNLLSSDWFAVGIKYASESRSSHSGQSNTGTFDLQVTYTIPTAPDPPTSLSTATGIPIVTSWTAPVDDGDSALTNYKVFRTLNELSQMELPNSSGSDSQLTFTDNEFLLHGLSGSDSSTNSITVTYNPLDPTGLQLYYDFNDGTTITNKASSVHGSTVEASATAGVVNGGMACNVATMSGFGTMCDFDGSDDYIEVGTDNADAFDSQTGTVMWWHKYDTSTGPDKSMVSITPSGGWSAHELDFTINTDNLGIVRAQYIGSPGSSYLNSPQNALSVNDQWYHIAWTSDGSTTKLYIDGVPITLNAVAGSNLGNWSADLNSTVDQLGIGGTIRSSAGNHVNGGMDELYIFNRALTETEIDNYIAYTSPTSGGGGVSTTGTFGTAIQDPNLTYTNSNLPDATDTLSVGGWVKLDEGSLVNTYTQTATDDQQRLGSAGGSGSAKAVGIEINSGSTLVGEKITSFSVSKNGDNGNSGSVTAYVYDSSGSVVATSTNTVSSTWSGYGTWTFDGTYALEADDKLVFYYWGGGYMNIDRNNGGGFDGNDSQYAYLDQSDVWQVYTGFDLKMTVTTTSVVAPTDTNLLTLNGAIFNVGTTTANIENTVSTTRSTGNAWDFAQDYVSLPSGFSTGLAGTNVVTYSLWFNTDEFSTSQGDGWDLIGSYGSTTGGGLADYQGLTMNYWYGSPGTINIYPEYHGSFSGNSYGQITHTNLGATATGTWYHLTAVYDGTATGNAERLKIYLDGTQKTFDSFQGNAVPSTISYGSVSNNWIGKPSYSTTYQHDFDGKIDDVIIYKNALSASQVTELYQTGSVSALSPYAHYNFEQTSGDLLDQTSNNNDGTNNGATQTATGTSVTYSTTSTLISATGLTSNTVNPQHYSFTRDGSNGWIIYQNGASRATATDSSSLGSNSGQNYSTKLDGTLDEFFINSDTLTATEIDNIFDRGETLTPLSTISSSGTTYSDSAVSGGTTYYYSVQAVNSIGSSDYITPFVSGLAGTPPNPPTSISATIANTATAPLDVTVSWSAPTDVGSGTLSNFQIFRDGVSQGTVGLVTTFADTVPSSGTYAYTVKAISNHGTSVASSADSITTPSLPSQPTLTVTVLSDTSHKLDWSASNENGSTLQGYKIEYSLDNSSWSNLVSNTGNTAVTRTATSLNVDDQYYWKVSGINGVGTGTASSTQNAWTLLSAPTNLVATATSISNINLAWTGISGISSYTIQYESPTGNGFTNLATSVSSSATTYSSGSLTTGTQYNYRIVGVSTNSGSNSVASNEDSANTFGILPAPVLDLLTSVSVNPATVQLDWTASTGSPSATGYKIERNLGSGFVVLESDTASVSTTYTDSATTTLNEPSYRVSSINSYGTSPASNELTLSVVVSGGSGGGGSGPTTKVISAIDDLLNLSILGNTHIMGSNEFITGKIPVSWDSGNNLSISKVDYDNSILDSIKFTIEDTTPIILQGSGNTFSSDDITYTITTPTQICNALSSDPSKRITTNCFQEKLYELPITITAKLKGDNISQTTLITIDTRAGFGGDTLALFSIFIMVIIAGVGIIKFARKSGNGKRNHSSNGHKKAPNTSRKPRKSIK